MDKIFTPNKFFVAFCALLVVAVLASNYIRDERIKEQAKLIARQQAEWDWPAQGVTTTADEMSAKILKRSENDAEVEVEGKQMITQRAPGANNTTTVNTNNTAALAGSAPANGASSSSYKAILTLYKNGNSRIWLLGKVEEL